MDMVKGRGQYEWDHTAALLAMLVNVNRGKKGAAAKPTEFNPFRLAASQKRAREKAPITILRDVFVDGKNWNRN